MKFIIDLPDEIAEASVRYWKETTDMTLAPYIEPDCEAIEDEVWELARIVTSMNMQDYMQCFGEDAALVMTYQEAKAKYEIWKRDKEEIHVGDEVKPKTSQRKGTVISEGIEYVRVLLFEDVDYPFISAWEKKNVIKTGRHFDEVERLLERMREQE